MSPNETSRRALVIDDHPLYRDALVDALQRQRDLLVVRGVASAQEARDVACREGPFVLVVADQQLPDGQGLDLLGEARWGGSARVLMSGSNEPALVLRAQRLGLCAFLPKTLSPQRMLDVLGRVMDGDRWFEHDGVVAPTLTERQLAVLKRAAQGQSNRAIGEALGVSERTVKDHMTLIFQRLDVANRAQAVARGAELGLLPPRQGGG
jgi:DNA-binding NarL/FixJ family response regulator